MGRQGGAVMDDDDDDTAYLADKAEKVSEAMLENIAVVVEDDSFKTRRWWLSFKR